MATLPLPGAESLVQPKPLQPKPYGAPQSGVQPLAGGIQPMMAPPQGTATPPAAGTGISAIPMPSPMGAGAVGTMNAPQPGSATPGSPNANIQPNQNQPTPSGGQPATPSLA